jgi:alkylhydroperoxidase family enzyme
VPRLGQIARSDDNPKIVRRMYTLLFGDRDPVAEPGTATGTPGDWWTVWANSPDVLEHAVGGFALYASPDRKIAPALRELGQTRAGWLIGSQFVFSQHCKSCRTLGYSEEKIEALKHWQVSDEFDELERALLAYTDGLVLAHGRVADGVFAVLKKHLSDEAILEFTYITMTYALHAVMSVALRTEFDDRDDPIVEVAAPEGYQAANIGRQISGRDDGE